MNKKKIINDPVYGFITIRTELVFDIITHPWFQRLRHIRQLGLTDYVFPGAIHTRFQHALGALHLMGRVLDSLRTKGVDISEEEFEAAQVAILLHDIGHGPFSHTLEETLLRGIKHETLSYLLMQALNERFHGKLTLALKIFRNSYSRHFFHALVSSQLDIDRLDYLKRDSFFTGVQEGTIGVDRIISMLHVYNDQLVVEEKGIYSIENFLHARRLMYWQVYLHKTTVSAERMLVNIIRRAQALVQGGTPLPATRAFAYFLEHAAGPEQFASRDTLEVFGNLDDNDVWGAIKLWKDGEDPILSTLCRMLLERKLFHVALVNGPINKKQIEEIREAVSRQFRIVRADAPYFFSYGSVSNEAYTEGRQINILMRDGRLLEMALASDLPNIKALTKIVKKNYLCWPKNLSLQRDPSAQEGRIDSLPNPHIS